MLTRLWRRCPVVIRATLVALVILMIGQAPPGIALTANLRLAPRLPLFLPIALVWLWGFWRYLDGWGWPRSTADERRRDLRGAPPRAAVWGWALVAGGLGVASVMSLALFTSRIVTAPPGAQGPPFDLSIFPWWTVLSFFLVIVATAGVVEEAAFRGYMLSRIEGRHGRRIAAVLVALLFYVVHIPHAYATLAFLPFFVAYSGVLTLLVFLSRSLLPSVVLHAVGDFCVLPMQYHVIDLPFGTSFAPYLAATVVFGAAAVPAFARLRRAAA